MVGCRRVQDLEEGVGFCRLGSKEFHRRRVNHDVMLKIEVDRCVFLCCTAAELSSLGRLRRL